MDLTCLSDGDLRALVKALHEARFPEQFSDPLVWSAPFVVKLHTDCLNELFHREDARGKSSLVRRKEWLSWAGRPENVVVLSHIRSSHALCQLILMDPLVMQDYLFPFTLGNDDLDGFVMEAQAVVASKATDESSWS